MVALARAGGSDVAGFRARARACLAVAVGRWLGRCGWALGDGWRCCNGGGAGRQVASVVQGVGGIPGGGVGVRFLWWGGYAAMAWRYSR